MKTKFNSHADVCNAWASQSSTEGHGSNIHFYGESIYSYGMHFCIARVVKHEGRECILFTTEGYSVSTAKHIGRVRSAIARNDHMGSLQIFNVPQCDSNLVHADNLASYLKRINDAKDAAERSRKYKDSWLQDVRNLQAEALAYVEFFGLQRPDWLHITTNLMEEVIA